MNVSRNKALAMLKLAIEAIRGKTEFDCTTMPIKQAVLFLALPMMLEMVLESVFALVDIFFVGRLGADAVATVGITESLMTIVYAISMGVGVAASAIVSRRIGEKNQKDAAHTALQTLFLSLIVGMLIALPGVLLLRPLFRVMGAGPVIMDEYLSYPLILLAGNVVIVFLFTINALFRAAGQATVAMRVLWTANAINIVLDPLLIFGIGPFPRMGIAGAATATTIGRGLAVCYQFYILFRKDSPFSLRGLALAWDRRVIWKIVKLSFGTIGQNLIATASWIGMVRIIAIFGSQVLAGYTIAIRLMMFFLLPAWGLSNAAATLVGQNLGAGFPERAEKSTWITGFVNMFLMLIVAFIFWQLPTLLVSFFTSDLSVLENGVICLRIIGLAMPVYGLGMVLIHAFNGAGDTITPTFLFLAVFWLTELPLAYFLAVLAAWGASGAYWAIVMAETLLTLISIWLFRRGRWKTRNV